MQPQGTGVVNTSYLDNLTAQVNGISGTGACAELQSVVNAAAASINAELAAVRAQLAALLPLTTPPGASLGAISAYLTNLAAPYLAAYNNLNAQLTAQLAAIGRLETAIASAASRLTSCTITIPPMT